MPNTLTCLALNTRMERATAEIRAYGPITQRGTLCITIKITSTASRPVPIEATTTATSRAISFIRTTETVLTTLVDTIYTWTVTLDCTQWELVIRDREQRSRIPITSHPPYPWRGQTNITGLSRCVHVDRCSNAIDARIGQEVSVIFIREICVTCD